MLPSKIKKRDEKRKVDSEFFETLEEVFDGSTVMAAYDLIRKKIIDHFNGAVASGKESRIYWAISPEGKDLAVKIYLTTSAEFRKSIKKYLDEEMMKSYSRGYRWIIYEWCKREFSNLTRAYNANVRVPRPIAYYKNLLVMEFIGWQGRPAPLIKDFPPNDPDNAYKIIINYIEKLYKVAKIVHSDLSEFNIMNFNDDLVIIDLGQSVRSSHPMAEEYLLRDITNITRFFKFLGAKVEDPWIVFNKITGY